MVGIFLGARVALLAARIALLGSESRVQVRRAGLHEAGVRGGARDRASPSPPPTCFAGSVWAPRPDVA